MRNRTVPNQTDTISPNHFSDLKPLGGYLVDAGLITPSQVEVALIDQQVTGMRFGEVLVARGWVREQTIEYLMSKVVLPERQAYEPAKRIPTTGRAEAKGGSAPVGDPKSTAELEDLEIYRHRAKSSSSKGQPKLAWGELPISKPTRADTSPGEDIDWLG